MRCTEFRELIPSLADGSIDGATRRAWALHLTECAECAAIVEDEETWLGAVHRILDHKAPDDLRQAILTDGRAADFPGGRRGLWAAIARYVWHDMTWRTWAEVLAVAGLVMVATNWYTGRDDAQAAFATPGAVEWLAAPDANHLTVTDGTLYLTDRLF